MTNKILHQKKQWELSFHQKENFNGAGGDGMNENIYVSCVISCIYHT